MNSTEPIGSETQRLGFESPYLEAANSACLARPFSVGSGGSRVMPAWILRGLLFLSEPESGVNARVFAHV